MIFLLRASIQNHGAPIECLEVGIRQVVLPPNQGSRRIRKIAAKPTIVCVNELPQFVHTVVFTPAK